MRVVIFVIVTLCLTPSAYAQIPVTDAASLSQQTTAHGESMAKYVEQIQQLKAQVEQQRQQYAAVTGSRGLGMILNDPRWRELLPADWRRVYDQIRAGDLSGLTQGARRIIEETCQGLVDDPRQRCELQTALPAQQRAMTTEAYAKAQQRLAQIDALMGQINQTEDPKAIAELQARIAAEQAAVASEQNRLTLLQLSLQAEDRLQAQRKHEAAMQEAAKTGRLQLQPINFGQPETP